MPELPEVETLARELRETLVGRNITRVSVHWARTIAKPDPETFARRLQGQRILEVRRRGKWLLLGLEGGDWLLLHLRMSGGLRVRDARTPEDPHVRLVFHLDDGRWLDFSDPRKFGRAVLTAHPSEVLRDLGPDPLDPELTPQRLEAMLRGRRARLKPLLMDQRFLAGIGNIYADEILWEAGLHPLRRADTLSPEETEHLYQALRRVLERAIQRGGTTLPDRRYVRLNGSPGDFTPHLAVYGRAGRSCPRCGNTILRVPIGGRSAHFCKVCQK
ncbi:MAG: bifunctional DNA-formamidopyrimidine glycosylase/DNA-(apurinic or apyrimidinic site) lyase [Thermoflexia bacterium]|nr:MAG: bifunctional DNA-formamidopyrimidine glycosylase/DNA-(apurinic or apyrimidinic site) lyase [Thermoflexia bacterium]